MALKKCSYFRLFFTVRYPDNLVSPENVCECSLIILFVQWYVLIILLHLMVQINLTESFRRDLRKFVCAIIYQRDVFSAGSVQILYNLRKIPKTKSYTKMAHSSTVRSNHPRGQVCSNPLKSRFPLFLWKIVLKNWYCGFLLYSHNIIPNSNATVSIMWWLTSSFQ